MHIPLRKHSGLAALATAGPPNCTIMLAEGAERAQGRRETQAASAPSGSAAQLPLRHRGLVSGVLHGGDKRCVGDLRRRLDNGTLVLK